MVTDPAEASGPFPFLGTNPIEIEPLELAVSVCEGVWKCLQIFDVFGLECFRVMTKPTGEFMPHERQSSGSLSSRAGLEDSWPERQ